MVRLKAPAGFKIRGHRTPTTRTLPRRPGVQDCTGEKPEPSKGTSVKAGGDSFVAKGMTHYAWFTEESVLQLHGVGPQGVTYVDPSDDPRKK